MDDQGYTWLIFNVVFGGILVLLTLNTLLFRQGSSGPSGSQIGIESVSDGMVP